jgi:hypothetical protein
MSAEIIKLANITADISQGITRVQIGKKSVEVGKRYALRLMRNGELPVKVHTLQHDTRFPVSLSDPSTIQVYFETPTGTFIHTNARGFISGIKCELGK